ncbi:MAG: right-handed parallel beta-helix repeat-containing protein, partial [Bacteroidota bacterium]
MRVESVAWISERKDVLFVFFYLASLFFYLDYTGNSKVKNILISLLLFVISLLSKLSAVTLPVNLWGHTATYMMGYIYVIGGSSSTTENTALNTVYYSKVNALNTLSAFTPGTAISAARNRHSAVTYNSKLYVIGGYDNSGTKAATVYIATPGLDGSTGTWTLGTALPVAVSNHASVVTNGIISVMAGAVGATLSNTVYYANADAGSLTWSTSASAMYDNIKDGSAFQGNGNIFFTGGTNLSGSPVYNCRYAPMTLSANYVSHGVFVSNPFYELGAERIISSISFVKTVTAPATLQVTYRTAGSDGIWSSWNALGAASPITIGLTKQYLQYAIILTGSTTFNATLNEMTLTTPGTQLNGDLNSILTFTKVASPYWATSNISFTAGTHTFEAGSTVLFLPETGLTVGAAHVECVGNAVDSVKFLYFTSETGKWNGIYFNENSDAGVTSNFSYTVIANAGFGAQNANLSCYATSEPTLSRCSIRYADGNGISLNAAQIIIQNSVVKGNTENGIYINNSNPVMNNTFFSYNGISGVLITSDGSIPNYTNTTINNNLYAIYYPSVNVTILNPLGTLTLTNNTYNGICLPGGNVTDNNRWNSLSPAFPILILDDLYIGKYNSVCRLTIEPGNTIKMAPGKKIQVGYFLSWHCAGEIYAVGAADSVITFTPINGAAGGWEGIYFEDRSDLSGAASVMYYCVVEKGNAYNIYSENTTQPSMDHCTIRNAVLDGIKFYGAYNTVANSTITANGRYPVYFSEPLTFPTLNGNSYTGNTISMIGYCGGYITENRTFQNDGVPYHIMDSILVGKYNSVSALTIEPGVTLNFASGKNIQIGYFLSYHCGGGLNAVGKSDSIIVFKPYSGVTGDWKGIYFEDRSDFGGAVSEMKYCNVQKANAYNVLCENTASVTIDHCTITNAVTDGLRINAAYGSFTYNTFSNNGRYPVYFMDWTSEPYHKNNTFTANVVNMIALSGGVYNANRTITKDYADYLVLDNIIVGLYNSSTRLTINPGVNLNFASGKYMQIGYFSGWHCGGELFAVGKADSIINFKPASGITGDWNGIYFEDRSDF